MDKPMKLDDLIGRLVACRLVSGSDSTVWIEQVDGRVVDLRQVDEVIGADIIVLSAMNSP